MTTPTKAALAERKAETTARLARAGARGAAERAEAAPTPLALVRTVEAAERALCLHVYPGQAPTAERIAAARSRARGGPECSECQDDGEVWVGPRVDDHRPCPECA